MNNLIAKAVAYQTYISFIYTWRKNKKMSHKIAVKAGFLLSTQYATLAIVGISMIFKLYEISIAIPFIMVFLWYLILYFISIKNNNYKQYYHIWICKRHFPSSTVWIFLIASNILWMVFGLIMVFGIL